MTATPEEIRNMEQRLDMLEPEPRHVAAISYAIGMFPLIEGGSIDAAAEDALREYRDQLDPDGQLEERAKNEGALFNED